jgi:hypothetical protein
MTVGRSAVFAATLLSFVVLASTATAGNGMYEPVDAIFSGQSAMVIIDGNGNGPDSEDCRYEVKFTFETGELVITPVQDENVSLKACSGAKFGFYNSGSDESSDFAQANFTSTDAEPPTSPTPRPELSGLLNVPVNVELIEETGQPNGVPIDFNQITIQRPGGPQQPIRIDVCDADGAAAAINFPNGMSLLLQMSLYPDAAAPSHLGIPTLPFERVAPSSEIVLLNAYLPLKDGIFTAAFADSPEITVLRLDPRNLGPCGARQEAPAAAEWALAALLLALLALGTWRLRRRSAFARSLSRL